MLEVHEALKLLLDAVERLTPVERPVQEALGLTLAERVVADRDFPPTDRSAMDGFAVRAADCVVPGRSLMLKGEIRAGQDATGIFVGPGEAVRILTGGVIPRGADAVVMVELTEEDRRQGSVVVRERPEPGQHVRRRGEDIQAGEAAIDAGTILRPMEVAALAAVGRTHVAVVRPPRVAVISTGDEIVEADATPAPHQVRNSNAQMLMAQLRSMRAEASDLGIASDDRPTLDALIASGLTADVLILTGGVSVGEYDLVLASLIEAGCEVLFHNVAMRPGKPLLAARGGGCLVFGLPGNPVSAFTSFQVFVAPALRKLMGHPAPVMTSVRATLDAELRRRPGRMTYHLARLRWLEGNPFVTAIPSASSGDALSLVRANAFVVTEGSADPIPAGAQVDVLPWD